MAVDQKAAEANAQRTSFSALGVGPPRHVRMREKLYLLVGGANAYIFGALFAGLTSLLYVVPIALHNGDSPSFGLKWGAAVSLFAIVTLSATLPRKLLLLRLLRFGELTKATIAKGEQTKVYIDRQPTYDCRLHFKTKEHLEVIAKDKTLFDEKMLDGVKRTVVYDPEDHTKALLIDEGSHRIHVRPDGGVAVDDELYSVLPFILTVLLVLLAPLHWWAIQNDIISLPLNY